MKLPADVILEALSALGVWSLEGETTDEVYGYPRQFDGSAPDAGCVLVPTAEALEACRGRRGLLAVCLFPRPAEGAPTPAIFPETPADGRAAARRLTALYDRLEDWDEALTACSHDLEGVQQMLEITAALTRGSLGLVDESYNMPAYTWGMAVGLGLGDGPDERRINDESVAALAEDPQIAAARPLRGVRVYLAPDGGVSLFCNLFRPGEESYFNRLLFARPGGSYSRLDYFVLERLADRLEQITRTLPTYAMPVSRYAALQSWILSAAATAPLPETDAPAVLSPLGWRQEDAYRMLTFRSIYSRRDAGISEFILRQLERLLPASCGVMDEEALYLLLNVSRCPLTFREVRSRLAEFLRENLYKAGISNEIRGFARLRDACRQAAAAMELGALRDPMFWYYLFEDYLGDYLLHKAGEDISPELLTLPAVEQLRRYDAERGTSFFDTLRVYAAENFNATHAAQRLYIHRTSFQDRMERIRALTGLDLDNGDVRFLLTFSFRLLTSERG